MPKIAEVIDKNDNNKIHLGILMELFTSDREDMGALPQHPEVHVSDGFELDTAKILTLPHRTAKAQLEAELRKGSAKNLTIVKDLELALSEAEAKHKASPGLIKSKEAAHGPDAGDRQRPMPKDP